MIKRKDSYNLDDMNLDEIHEQARIRKTSNTYSKFDFEQEMMGIDVIDLIDLLHYKKNIILQGAPGVGKTYSAKRLAWAVMGEKDNSRITMTQFHQSYGYEDFVLGLRPTEDGTFHFEEGPFYNICKQAEKDPEHRDFFLIIDEINRGNISKILGEAFSLIEASHRGDSITLKYRNEKFSVPDNLYIIGTMNTADRGLVVLDYALRRRFGFFTINPGYKSEAFRRVLAESKNPKVNRVAKKIIDLNKEISEDDMLGPGFMIGHSYFCLGGEISDQELSNIVNYEIMPLLEEYWYDNTKKISKWRDIFTSIIEGINS